MSSSPAWPAAPNAPADPPQRGHRRVLIVEDHPTTRAALSRLLEQGGHEVAAAPDALRGLRLLRERRPDRLLLDLMLPDLPGEHLLEAVRALSPGTRVAVLTGVADDGRLARLHELGAERVMRKPVDLPAVLDWVASD